MSRVLEWGLRAWAALLVAASVVWVLGPSGVNVVQGATIDRLGSWAFVGPLNGLLTGPIFGAYLEDESAQRSITELSAQINPDPTNAGLAEAFGDINLGWSVQFTSVTGEQNLAFVALHVVPLLVMAVLWWLLAGMVRDSRTGSAFTVRNARILTGAGAVLLVGSPLVTLATWLFRRWVVASSQIADRVRVPDFGWGWMPWSVMATGLALIVLGVVWRRGVRLEHDVAGLV